MRRIVIVTSLAALALAGCGARHKAAESAIADVQVSFAAISDQAVNLMPDEAKSLRDALDQARDELDRGNDSATLVAARSLRVRVKEMAERLPDKQSELETTWRKFESSVPRTLAILDGSFRRANRGASGTQRTRLDAHLDELRSVENLWDEAQSAHQFGRVAEAVTKAGDVRYRALRLLDVVQAGS